jgi:hypothetical protein
MIARELYSTRMVGYINSAYFINTAPSLTAHSRHHACTKWLPSLIVLALTLCQCTSDTSSQAQFLVTPKFSREGNKVVLDYKFQSKEKQTFLLNCDALSVYDPNFEREDLLKNIPDLNRLLDSLKYSQFVIENKKNEKRFFSDIKLFEGEEMAMKSVFSFEDKVDTVSISIGKEALLSTDTILINRLKINKSDDEIRLHYLFHPTVEQTQLGYRPMLITSNWFKLQK